MNGDGRVYHLAGETAYLTYNGTALMKDQDQDSKRNIRYLGFESIEDGARRFDFANVHLPAQEVIDEVARMGGIVVPCHPGRPNVGLFEHYGKKPALENVVAIEVYNGGSRKGEDERSQVLAEKFAYGEIGGSDSHLVSLIGLCATRFEGDLRTVEDLVRELKTGSYEPVDFRPRRKPVQPAIAVEVK